LLTPQAVSLPNEFLCGDWLRPAAEARCVVLIWPGSGPTDGDGNQPGLEINNLRDLALAFVEKDVASLRVDKRGVGRSRAALVDESRLTFDTYVEDAVQWIRWLQKENPTIPIVLLGHSEGALIVTLAAQRIDVSGVVALCAPARRASDVLRAQLKDQLPPHLVPINEAILRALESGQPYPGCPDELQVLYRQSVQPYLRSWFQHDPQKAAASLSCSYLWIWGDADEQLPNEHQHLTNAQMHRVLSGMDHAMRNVSDSMQLHADLIPAIQALGML
jgi:uncharacterized protein